MNNLGIIAAVVFVSLTLILLAIPKTAINNRLKKDMSFTEADIKKGNGIGYYKMLVAISGLLTIVIMLVIKYATA